MKKLQVLMIVAAVLSQGLMSGSALAQGASLAPVVAFKTERQVTLPAGEYDLFQGVNDFRPGAVATLHAHDGPGLATLIQGDIVNRRMGEPEKPYKTGESFLCGTGEPSHSMVNTGTGPARLLVAFALPKGAPVSRPVTGIPTPTPPSGPAATSPFRARMAVGELPTQFVLIQLVEDFAPEAKTPVQTHGGIGMSMVIDGEVTVIPRGGEAIVYKPGGVFLQKPGDYALMRNSGSIPARLLTVFALPTGATLTTVQQADAPRITMDEFKALYDSANRPMIIDVRDKGGYDAGHIRGAISFPEAEVDARIAELPKDKLIVAYCA